MDLHPQPSRERWSRPSPAMRQDNRAPDPCGHLDQGGRRMTASGDKPSWRARVRPPNTGRYGRQAALDVARRGGGRFVGSGAAVAPRTDRHGRLRKGRQHDDLLDHRPVRHGHVDLTSTGYGVFIAVSSLAGFLSSFSTAKIRQALGYRLLVPCALALGAGTMLGLFFTTSPYVAALLLAVYIFNVTAWTICVVSLRQRLVPGDMRGRQNSFVQTLRPHRSRHRSRHRRADRLHRRSFRSIWPRRVQIPWMCCLHGLVTAQRA